MVSCSSAMEQCPPGFLPLSLLVLLGLVGASWACARRARRIVRETVAQGRVQVRKGPNPLLWQVLLVWPVAYLDRRSFLDAMATYGRPAVVFMSLIWIAVGIVGAFVETGPAELRLASAAMAAVGPIILCPGAFAIAKGIREGGALPPAPPGQDW